jgi:hypothetical protein
LTPERRLWTEVANTLLYEFDLKMARIESDLDTFGVTSVRMKREIEALYHEAQREWFGQICDFAECHADHVIAHLKKKMDDLGWGTIITVENQAPRRIRKMRA